MMSAIRYPLSAIRCRPSDSTSALEHAYAGAERVTAEWARSFYFASRFLPPEKRRATFALYDYCRFADNLVDARGDRPVGVVRTQLADLEPVAIPDFATLYRYCRLVAGSVGLMLGPVLGAPNGALEDPGVRLGVAMQLTNVLRDVAEDLDAGRLYLPADELARFDLDRAVLQRRRMTPQFRRFMAFQVARARRWFQRGGQVVSLFPTDGSRLTVRLLQQ